MKKFIEWQYIRVFTGRNDWHRCRPGCPRHQYSNHHKTALKYLGVIKDESELDNASPETHFLCRIACEQHTTHGVQTYKGSNISNIGQHIMRKSSYAPAAVSLVRLIQYILY